MIDTNALLISALALITNFTNTLQVPSNSAPHNVQELCILHFPGPHAETDVWLKDGFGNKFHIQTGVVKRFTSKDSIFHSVAKKTVSKGETQQIISSNEVLTIASNQVQRLVKSGHPLNDTNMRMDSTRVSEESSASSFKIDWLKVVEPVGELPVVEIEIDARTGNVLDIELSESGFCNPIKEAEMRIHIHKPDLNTNIIRKPNYAWEHPSKERVEEVLRNWSLFCRLLNIKGEWQTNASQVNWNNTILAKDKKASDSEKACFVSFTNGATVSSFRNTPYSFVTADVCYNGDFQARTREGWTAFQGIVKLKWEDVASLFDERLSSFLSLSNHSLTNTTRHACYWTPTISKQGLVRTVIEYDKEALRASDSVSQREPLFYFECDLETGEIKSMTACNSEFIQWLSESMLVAMKRDERSNNMEK